MGPWDWRDGRLHRRWTFDSDASDPGDWITAAEDRAGTFQGCGAEDSSWHGTMVSGIIGAKTNDGIGMGDHRFPRSSGAPVARSIGRLASIG